MEEFEGDAAQAADLVRRARKARGWNQSVLAQHAGVSRKFVSDFETGHPRAEWGKAMAVLSAVGVKVRFLETKRPNKPVKVDLHEHVVGYSAGAESPFGPRK